MKEFKDIINKKPIFESHEIQDWDSTDILEGERIYTELMQIYENEGVQGFESLDEGLLGKIIGGVAGFVIGPSIGKVIANALGIERGLLYDMLTSRLVGAALGAALTKNLGK
jgi:hypothetical protein